MNELAWRCGSGDRANFKLIKTVTCLTKTHAFQKFSLLGKIKFLNIPLTILFAIDFSGLYGVAFVQIIGRLST